MPHKFLCRAKVLPELPASGLFRTDVFVGKLIQFVSGRKFPSGILWHQAEIYTVVSEAAFSQAASGNASAALSLLILN